MEMEFFSKAREEVGVMGLVMGLDVGESLCSFDRIFFKNPSVGIGKDPDCGRMALLSRLGSTNSKLKSMQHRPQGKVRGAREGGQRRQNEGRQQDSRRTPGGQQGRRKR